jgi:hypothetical protein
MMPLYVAFIAVWEAMYDACLWTRAASPSSNAKDERSEKGR